MIYLKRYKNGITFKKWLENNPISLDGPIIDCRKEKLIDLNGIEEFINLRFLYCGDNKLTELPDLNNLCNLQILNCSHNRLTKLPDLSSLKKLQYLYCRSNKLSKLPDLTDMKNLMQISCYDNDLPYNDLREYLEWHKKEYPWVYDAKKYNL
jgi:Leucine-rich repeat (LRR) protein